MRESPLWPCLYGQILPGFGGGQKEGGWILKPPDSQDYISPGSGSPGILWGIWTRTLSLTEDQAVVL